MTFKEKVFELNSKLGDLEKVEGVIREKRAEFETMLSADTESKKTLSEEISNLKKELSEMCIDDFKKNGIKKFYGGLAIRETEKQVYSDDKAMEWATKTGMCLALDKKKFESIAKTGELDFVTTEVVPSTTFPKEIKL